MVKRDELPELHYIAPIANVGSILVHGILSHRRVAGLPHQSVAKPAIQDRRSKKSVPGGRPLHEYVNLYIHARNPMMFLRRDQHANLCVLCISTQVLDLPGVVIADQNASSDYVRFGAAPGALDLVDGGRVFAEYWTHPDDLIEEWRHKSIKCAEVLVPDWVEPEHISRAYVSCQDSQQTLQRMAPALSVVINPPPVLSLREVL